MIPTKKTTLTVIIEMREGMDKRLMKASEKIWTVPYSFSKSTKEVFNVQKAWHSPNRSSIMVHGQAFRIIT